MTGDISKFRHAWATYNVILSIFFLVVLDTNRWYHKTEVQPGELSITIGAEYD